MNYIETNNFNGVYSVKGWDGVAWYILGLETVPNDETEWTGLETETGNVVAVMVGDDEKYSIDPDNLTELGDGDYCKECGQIGCGCCL